MAGCFPECEVIEVVSSPIASSEPHWSLARIWSLQSGIPGSRTTFRTATKSHVDVVVLDIEDGLPDAQKTQGRGEVADRLTTGGKAWVRINLPQHVRLVGGSGLSGARSGAGRSDVGKDRICRRRRRNCRSSTQANAGGGASRIGARNQVGLRHRTYTRVL